MAHIQIQLDTADLSDAVLLGKLTSMFQAFQSRPGNVRMLAVTPVAPDDNPAAGIPTPSEAFGLGNGAAGLGSASSPSPVPTTAVSTAASTASTTASDAPSAATLSPSAAFGNGGNVPPIPNGAPPLPPVMPTTPQPGAIAPPPVAPTPPTPAAAPVPAPATASSTGPVPLDAEGLPWDARIHSSSKERIANNTWKLKRGVAQQEVWLNQIKAELRAAVGAAPAATPAPQAPVGNVPIGSPIPLPPTTPATAGSNALTMAHLLPRVTAAISYGKLTPDQAGAICSEVSGGAITNIAMMAVRPDLIPAVWARLDQMGVPQ